ncbi:MAG: ECF transporter S component [Clostridia bacterium]
MKGFGSSAKAVAYTAVMTALVAVCTMLGINIGTGYVNMGDAMIFVTATLFGGAPAMIAGGIGSFLADMIVYPTTMWFTLVIKGLEGLACGLLAHYLLPKFDKKKPLKITMNVVFMLAGAVIMVSGYFGTQWLMWGTKESALAQLPWDCLQAVTGATVATLLLYCLRLESLVEKQLLAVGKKKHSDKPDSDNAVDTQSEKNASDEVKDIASEQENE